MSKKDSQDMIVEFTPLEKIEALYEELLDWYGEADSKQLRVAAKFLLLALEKFSIHGGNNWHELVTEYIDILHKDPEKFQKIIEANRGELKEKKSNTRYH
ncbi:hypothetical protein GCM10007891_20540 [Methylophaga thalassica]|uniref:Uncharacterized protein n=1 Tax=Methylophaga thalassica TaxID=40223 RepID=A0ABQ5TXC4_9GAMM|nr:hypothetical protein [Methylophaga thalassica]GLQ00201.1 hypothetical protein GCM10007891_20540 [Methylophaga thalassica]